MRRARLLVPVLAVVIAALAAAIGGASTRTATTELFDTEDGSLEVGCPQGQRVVLAGMRAEFDPGGQEDMYIEELSRPSKGTVRAGAYANSTNPAELTAIATCKRKPRSQEVSETITVGDDGGLENDSVTAVCPKGKRIVFGGFRGDLTFMSQFVQPVAAYAESARRWTVVGVGGTFPGDLTALAYCGKARKTKERSATVPIGEDPDAATATAKCKRKERFAYGGFDVNVPGTDDELIPTGLEKTGRRAWSVTAANDGAPADDVTAHAYCVKKKKGSRR